MKNYYLSKELPTWNTDFYSRYLLFIYEKFNDAAKYSDIIASNGKMNREMWV